MKYSVEFDNKNGRSYYKNHREKYHLKNESAVIEVIPPVEKRLFYYFDGTSWIMDEELYQKSVEEAEKAAGESASAVSTEISMEELLAAIMELAQNQSDIEDALLELAALQGGE